jgi:tRNA modification GTPase
LLQLLGSFAHVRPAEPGEFARRAFLNGKMDLAEVEGLADLIDAETDWQRRQALRQMGGRLSAAAKAWRAAILEASALLEATIDFAEEEDVPAEVRGRISTLLEPVLSALQSEITGAARGERIRDGLTIVIAGPPNAGKSTLLNMLARREVAIVSPFAGTTRDMIEVHLDLEGFPVILIDTAGLRESADADAVEAIGILRARERAQSADLVLWLSEAAAPVEPPPELRGIRLWRIFTKIDQAAAIPIAKEDALSLSATTGENIDVLLQRLASFAEATLIDGYEGLVTRERHRRAFEMAAQALARVMEGQEIAGQETPVELLAEDIRLAAQALASIIGTVGVEDVLDEIFARFCIGK